MPKERITEQGSGHLTGRKYTDHVCTSHIRHVSTAQDRAERRCGTRLLGGAVPHGAGPRPATTPPCASSKASYSRAWRKLLNGQVSPGTGRSLSPETAPGQQKGPDSHSSSEARTGAAGRGQYGADPVRRRSRHCCPRTPRDQIFLIHLASDRARRRVSVRSRCRCSCSAQSSRFQNPRGRPRTPRLPGDHLELQHHRPQAMWR